MQPTDDELMKPVHRDDLEPEIIEALEKQFDGYKVVCLGDLAEVPPEYKAILEAIEQRHRESIAKGTCIDCGKHMPNYAAIDTDDDWQPENGWTWFTNGEHPVAWQCPECGAKEESNDAANG